MFKPTTRRVATALATPILATTAIVAAPQAAQAITGQPCYGSSCVGKSPTWSNSNGNCAQGAYNPYTGTWADGAYTVPGASVTVRHPTAATYATVVLRYSPYCHSNWARVDVDTGGASVRFWVVTIDGNSSEHALDNSSNFTTMVDGTQLAKVCAQALPDPADGSPGPVCSAWF